MEQKKERFFSRLWTQESGLSGMLVLLLIMHFIMIPVFGSRFYFMVILNVFWMLQVIAGVFTLVKSRQKAIRVSVIPFLFMIFSWINIYTANFSVELVTFFLTIITVLMLIVLVLLKVFEPGPVNLHRIIGSVVVYMLLANLWGIVYLFVFNQIDGSFQLAESQFKINSELASFMYFSYITITSTGFGEILPLHPIARSLVQMQALIGILYPVILIGRLVSDVNSSPTKNT